MPIHLAVMSRHHLQNKNKLPSSPSTDKPLQWTLSFELRSITATPISTTSPGLPNLPIVKVNLWKFMSVGKDKDNPPQWTLCFELRSITALKYCYAIGPTTQFLIGSVCAVASAMEFMHTKICSKQLTPAFCASCPFTTPALHQQPHHGGQPIWADLHQRELHGGLHAADFRRSDISTKDSRPPSPSPETGYYNEDLKFAPNRLRFDLDCLPECYFIGPVSRV